MTTTDAVNSWGFESLRKLSTCSEQGQRDLGCRIAGVSMGVIAGAKRHDSALLAPTVDGVDGCGLLPRPFQAPVFVIIPDTTTLNHSVRKLAPPFMTPEPVVP